MKEHEIDAMVFAALSSPAGQSFHQWLVNNYLMGVNATVDPNQALFMNGQQSLVTSINTRFARHLERQAKEDESNSRGRRGRARQTTREWPGPRGNDGAA